MKGKLKFTDKEFLNRNEPQEEVKSVDTLDLMQYVTNLLYAAANEGPTMGNPAFDNWVDEQINNLKAYHAQFQTEQRQVITDEEISTYIQKVQNFPIASTYYRICMEVAKWAREQGKGIDLRKELIKLLNNEQVQDTYGVMHDGKIKNV